MVSVRRAPADRTDGPSSAAGSPSSIPELSEPGAGETVARLDGGSDTFFGWERAIGLAFVLAGFVVAGGVMTDNSLLTHLATGRLILDGGSVPSVDPYSRFGAGQDWTVQSWLVSVVYALLDRVAGDGTAIRLFHGVLGSVIGLGLWSLSRPAGHLGVRVGLAGWPLLVGFALWSPRPLLVGLVALVCLLLIVQQDRPGWLLVPLLWVWGNSHGSFPLAGGILVLLVVGQWLEHRRVSPDRLRLLGWAALGTMVAAVGPIGPRLLLFPLAVLGRRDAMTGVIEWEPPSYSSPGELAWLAIGLLPIVAARRGLGLARLVPAAVMTIAAALALRNVAPASIVVVALVAPALAGMAGSAAATGASSGTSAGSAPVQPERAVAAGRLRLSRAVAVASFCGLAIAIAAVATEPGLDLDTYPVAEIDALERAGLVADDEVVLVHREAVGNYLTFRFGDRARAFVDDRFDFHPAVLLEDHRDLLAGRNARDVLDRRDADVVLWELDSPLADWMTEAPEWSISRGEDWLVACRVGSAAAPLCPSERELATVES